MSDEYREGQAYKAVFRLPVTSLALKKKPKNPGLLFVSY